MRAFAITGMETASMIDLIRLGFAMRATPPSARISWPERVPAPSTADTPPTLAFDEALSVSGFAGCNQYTGAATIEGSSISLGPLATTQMACPGAAGIAETAFLSAMNEVEGFAIDSQGQLVLEDGVVLISHRPRKRPPPDLDRGGAATAFVAMIRPEAWS